MVRRLKEIIIIGFNQRPELNIFRNLWFLHDDRLTGKVNSSSRISSGAVLRNLSFFLGKKYIKKFPIFEKKRFFLPFFRPTYYSLITPYGTNSFFADSTRPLSRPHHIIKSHKKKQQSCFCPQSYEAVLKRVFFKPPNDDISHNSVRSRLLSMNSVRYWSKKICTIEHWHVIYKKDFATGY